MGCVPMRPGTRDRDRHGEIRPIRGRSLPIFGRLWTSLAAFLLVSGSCLDPAECVPLALSLGVHTVQVDSTFRLRYVAGDALRHTAISSHQRHTAPHKRHYYYHKQLQVLNTMCLSGKMLTIYKKKSVQREVSSRYNTFNERKTRLVTPQSSKPRCQSDLLIIGRSAQVPRASETYAPGPFLLRDGKTL